MRASGKGLLTHIALTHPGGSVGYRIDWPDRSLAFITDTVVDGSYSEFVRGVDLLIHECYFPDDMAEWATKTGHSYTTPVAGLARDAAVGRLMLMHIDPAVPSPTRLESTGPASSFPERSWPKT